MKKTIVKLSFPRIEREFTYEYEHDMEQDRIEPSLRRFYEQEAPELFALYGYTPMDVSVETDGEETLQVAACYQETLWHSFFCEGGEPWNGRIQPFITSLISFRWREDERDGLHDGIRLAA